MYFDEKVISDPSNSNPYKRQSIVIVPANAPGVTIVRPCNIMGQDDAPEGYVKSYTWQARLICEYQGTWRSAMITSRSQKATLSQAGAEGSRSFKDG